MSHTRNTYLPYVCLAVFAIPLFFLNIHDGHNWGDDFAGYLKEALNIASGKPFYQSGYIYNKFNTEYAPPQYPPGFPLMLAPVVKFWGISFRAFCYFNSVVAVGLLFALFAYFRKYAGVAVSICLSLILTYSGFMIDIKREVLSDVSCLLMITLYLTARNAPGFSGKRIIGLILLATMAVLIRSQAILLIAAEGIYFVIRTAKAVFHRQKGALTARTNPSLIIVAGSLGLLLLSGKVLFRAPLSTESFYGYFVNVVMHEHALYLLEINIRYLEDFLGAFFRFETHNALVWFGINCIQYAGLLGSIAGFFLAVRRRLSVDDIFFVLMCLMVLFLPIHGLRYFLPAVPVIYYYCFTVCKAVRPVFTTWPGRRVALIFTVVYLALGSKQLLKASKNVPQFEMPMPNDIQAFTYIKAHINDSDIILFEKPRALTLFTGKRCINTAWQLTPQRNKAVFDSLGIKYVLVLEGLSEDYYWSYLKLYDTPPDSARIGWGYTLYTLK